MNRISVLSILLCLTEENFKENYSLYISLAGSVQKIINYIQNWHIVFELVDVGIGVKQTKTSTGMIEYIMTDYLKKH